jgi:hypothetical protein
VRVRAEEAAEALLHLPDAVVAHEHRLRRIPLALETLAGHKVQHGARSARAGAGVEVGEAGVLDEEIVHGRFLFWLEKGYLRIYLL